MKREWEEDAITEGERANPYRGGKPLFSEAFVWTRNPVLEDDGIGYMYDLEYILIKTGAAKETVEVSTS